MCLANKFRSTTVCHKKTVILWQNLDLWERIVLFSRCMILWNRQRKGQYLSLMTSQRVALPMQYDRD